VGVGASNQAPAATTASSSHRHSRADDPLIVPTGRRRRRGHRRTRSVWVQAAAAVSSTSRLSFCALVDRRYDQRWPTFRSAMPTPRSSRRPRSRTPRRAASRAHAPGARPAPGGFGEFYLNPKTRTFAQLMIDLEEDPTPVRSSSENSESGIPESGPEATRGSDRRGRCGRRHREPALRDSASTSTRCRTREPGHPSSSSWEVPPSPHRYRHGELGPEYPIVGVSDRSKGRNVAARGAGCRGW
jgi:hypothetical protein